MTPIQQALTILQAGGLVAIPTETVYGLGADAANPDAIAKIFKAKERPADHPLIVHVADLSQLSNWAKDIPESAYRLAAAFWPGPLTLILKKQPHVLDIVTGSQDTVGIRIPRHAVAQALLQAFGGGIAAPSANKFTRLSPTTALAVKEELGDKVDLILEGGDCEVGLESTIIDMTAKQPIILRPGMITAEMIAGVLGSPITTRRQDTPNEVRAPGMHHLHYAPATPLLIVQSEELPAYLQPFETAASQPPQGERVGSLRSSRGAHEVRVSRDTPIGLITYSCHASDILPPNHINLPNNPQSYAHDLYHVLRELDHCGLEMIIVEAVPEDPAWEAIRDRLTKASGRL